MPTITLVFRGLLVLNEHQPFEEPLSMEIGILDEKHHHVPRIMTFRNGVREETTLLDMDHPTALWKLVVDDPVSTGITKRQVDPFNRLAGTGRDDDFRWVIDLEKEPEFPYGNIKHKFGLDRDELPHVLQISSGEFYTRLKSPVLTRSENGGAPTDFGAVAGVMGCNIQVNSGGARLIGENEEDVIFEFSSDPNVMYEIANSPADTEADPVDHFPHYYEIFKNQPEKKFGFEKKLMGGAGGGPGPNPALCGKIFLSELGDSLLAEDESKTTGTAAAEHEHEETSEHYSGESHKAAKS